MAWLHPKGQYSNPESIAVATDSPVAKMQVASQMLVRTGWYEWSVPGEQALSSPSPCCRLPGAGLRLTPP